MAWITPKTDWSATDHVSASDYNRIINNLQVLQELAKKLYGNINLESMGENVDRSIKPRPSMFNHIENNLETINEHTLNLDIGETKTYTSNGRTIDYNEFNRIEEGMLRLYNIIYWSVEALPKLPVKLGGERGLQV